jgi:hypothetical protein
MLETRSERAKGGLFEQYRVGRAQLAEVTRQRVE